MGKMGESGELGMVVAVSMELGSGPQVTLFVLWSCGVDVAGPGGASWGGAGSVLG